MKHQTGIELASIIPGLLSLCDVDELVQLVPDAMLLVSGEQDKYARDADAVARAAGLAHVRRGHGHALDTERFEMIVDWLAQAAVGRE